MKKLLILFALAFSHWAMAQVEVVEKSYPFTDHELDIDVELGTEISIKSWDKNEIFVKISYAINGGKTNEAVDVDIDDYKDRLAIDVRVNERKMNKSDYCCCRDGNVTYQNGNHRSSNCIEMLVEVSIPASADVRVKTVISDVIIEGMSGNVDVESVTGAIDLAWDESTGAEVTMKTATGDLYTSFDLNRRSGRGLPLISSHNVEGVYKSGEKEVYLKTVTSDIYFRKPDN